MIRRFIALVLLAGAASTTYAQAEGPEALVKRVSTDVLATIQADPSLQAGDVDRVVALVDAKILPSFDFERMTAAACGPRWKDATDQQKKDLEAQFKLLLVRVYAGALAQSRDRSIEMRPSRADPADAVVVVRTRIVGRGDPIGLDFRVGREGPDWKVFDMNVGGVWLVDNYRSTFAQELSAGGFDGLIAKLAEKNKAGASR